jgi:hypothetical protein
MYGRKNTRQGRSRTGRRPGQSAREQQQAIARRNPIKTAITRALGVPTMEQAWGKGAAGEERVGGLLNQLRQLGWTVLHDLKVGPHGANVDHLVIGPSGVSAIDTKHVSGSVWVAGPHIMVDGFSKDYVMRMEAQAMSVRERLLDATGWDSLWVQGILVFVTPGLTVKEPPRNVEVFTDDVLIPALRRMPARLDPSEVKELAQAARRESTWA